jgi:hypothetical protein
MTDPVITKQGALAPCKDMLRKDLYVVFTRPADSLARVLENVGPHLEFQIDLERRGIMFGAGPLWSDDEKHWHGEGMVIIRAANMTEARKIAESDPMHASGARVFTIRPWTLNEGTVTIKVNYSDGSREIV